MKEKTEEIIKQKKLDSLISLLPHDLQKKIYREYFYPKELHIFGQTLSYKLIREIKTVTAQQLNIKNIVPILEEILKNKHAIKHLLHKSNKNNEIYSAFSNVYNDIIVNKHKNFKNLDKIDDLALSILFHLYH